ncbi:hypothetical protein KIN20_013978 [Parelaphostrongylus tenuis]|uniref:Protein kinase domain-containing protein n=1 Tax=Parelaphostrongylus tenuis TaxID=148309 RepID=A0AAD5QRI1_PARTN|nr:hypothetical protein KIN20_013978 [Parelaphostrongylus tenuis]
MALPTIRTCSKCERALLVEPHMSDEEEDDLGITPESMLNPLIQSVEGTAIKSSKTNYVVVNLLGEGGFGAVYK